MTVLGILSILMSIALGWLIVRDLRREQTGLLIYTADRKSNGLGYWSFMAIWLMAMLFCLLFAIAALIAVSQCGGEMSCNVTVSIPEK